MKDISSTYEPSRKQISLFSVALSACRPPGVIVKFEVSQEGGESREAWGRRTIMWSRWGIFGGFAYALK